MLITSLQNPLIKHVAKLRESRERKKAGVMRVEGYEELTLALTSGVQINTLFYCPDLFREDAGELLSRLKKTGAELVEVTARVFEKIAYRENPDGWLAIVPVLRGTLADLKIGDQPLMVVIESVEKPGNLGAILRTSEAAGVDAVVICDPRTDLGNPNVLRPSRGALFALPIALSTSAEALGWLKARGIKTVAATPEGPTPFTEANLLPPIAIIVGAENQGLSALWRDNADLQVGIPMFGKINSLNVSVSTALFLYEAIRQRKL